MNGGPNLKDRFDLAVAGSGFAGSLLAMIAQKLGLRTILLERGRHPRVVIGESSTPLSNLLVEELAERYGLAGLRPLSKWGSWQSTHPELACGLKRGFTFLHHTPGQEGPIARANQLLVAASPRDAIADTHWYRADFDAYLMGQARQSGVTYLDQVDLRACLPSGSQCELVGSSPAGELRIIARFVVDATGPRGFLHRALGLSEHPLPGLPQRAALYSHFTGVRRLDETGGVALPATPPYPVDDAAVHHIFDGGWVWVLRFNNGITSAGIAATKPLADSLRLAEGEPAWQRLLQRFPVLQDTFREAQAVQPFRYLPHLGFRSGAIRGPRWALLPSAAGFADPLLSTGFPLALLGVARLAEIFEQDWETEHFDPRLDAYAAATDAELLAASRLIGALYANFSNFPVFAAVSLLYFAAASYAETARRLGHPQLASSFLLHERPVFGAECTRVLARAQAVHDEKESAAVIEEIRRVIGPIDVAGLTNPTRRNWYPVEIDDLLRAAYKVGASQTEILEMVERCEFNPPAAPAGSEHCR